MRRHRIEVLVFDGCPNIDVTLNRIDEAVAAAGAQADVEVVRVASDEEAVERRFIGSPTVRVGGQDVEPGAQERGDFGLQCRIYQVDGRVEHVPEVRWIHAALSGASGRERGRGDVGVYAAAGCCAVGGKGSE